MQGGKAADVFRGHSLGFLKIAQIHCSEESGEGEGGRGPTGGSSLKVFWPRKPLIAVNLEFVLALTYLSPGRAARVHMCTQKGPVAGSWPGF